MRFGFEVVFNGVFEGNWWGQSFVDWVVGEEGGGWEEEFGYLGCFFK